MKSRLYRDDFDGLASEFHTFSARERREADLFFADLMGESALQRRAPRVRRAPFIEQAPEPNTTAISPTHAAGICARDVAVTENTALLVTQNAPLPIVERIGTRTIDEPARVANNPGAIADYKSVCAIVPSTPEKQLLIFFHGNNNHVIVTPGSDGKAHSRGPRWATHPAAAQTKAAPIAYGFESLATTQAHWQTSSDGASRGVKNPVVLSPENGQRSTGKYWSVPPPRQYGAPNDGRIDGPGTTRLQDLVMECYEHLRCLSTPSGRKYLSPQMASSASWVGNIRRVYLSGHSGGGKPLVECAGSDMSLITPSSVMGVGARAMDLWLLDCTYGWGIENYVNFCKNWQKHGLLANRPDGARLVCIYIPNTDTENEANTLRSRLASLLQVDAAKLIAPHDSADMSSKSMTTKVIPKLLSSPVVFIRTQVAHPNIPSAFIPLLLRTAAS